MTYFAAILLLLLVPAGLQAGPPAATVAVMSSDRGAYREAFSAFQAEMDSEVMYFDLSKGRFKLPAGTRRVVAFGSRAASMYYPPGTDLIYCLAPGFFRPVSAKIRAAKVSMRPAPGRLLSGLRNLHPGLKRLNILWSAGNYTEHMRAIRDAAGAYGIEVTLTRVRRASQLPSALRSALEKQDAFWIPPDPLLVTRANLRLLRDFSCGNSMPIYSSTRGMAEEGTVASLGASFRASGKTAAKLLRSLIDGKTPPEMVYSQEIDLILNAGVARRCGIAFPPGARKSAAYILP